MSTIAIITIDNPPVNALPVAGWFQLADTLRTTGRDPDVRVVILRAEGKGFQAGVDIKELAADPTNAALIGVNRGCYEAFARGLRLRGARHRRGAGLLPRRRHRRSPATPTSSSRPTTRPSASPRSTAARSASRRTSRASCRSTSCARCSSRARWSPRAELLAFGTVERVVPRDELLDTALEIAAVDRRRRARS